MILHVLSPILSPVNILSFLLFFRISSYLLRSLSAITTLTHSALEYENPLKGRYSLFLSLIYLVYPLSPSSSPVSAPGTILYSLPVTLDS